MKTITAQQFFPMLRYQDPAKPLQEEIQRRAKYMAFFPEQAENILSYQDNPNCTCAAKLYASLESDTAKAKQVLTAVLGEEVSLVIPFQAAGQVREIHDSAEAWMAFCTELANKAWMFRSMVIVPGDAPAPSGWGGPSSPRTIRVYFY